MNDDVRVKVSRELTKVSRELMAAKSVDDLLRDSGGVSSELVVLAKSVKSSDVPRGIKKDIINHISEAKGSLQEAMDLLGSTRPTNLKNYIKMLHKGFEGVRLRGGKAVSDYGRVTIHHGGYYEESSFAIYEDKISVHYQDQSSAYNRDIPLDLKAHITGDIKTDIGFIAKFLRKNWRKGWAS
jgi:hypothetical protein